VVIRILILLNVMYGIVYFITNLGLAAIPWVEGFGVNIYGLAFV